MSVNRALFYDDNFDAGLDDCITAEAYRNQRIAERRDELVAECMAGAGDFFPPPGVRSDGAILPPEWDLEQSLALLAALRDSLAAKDPAIFGKATLAAFEDYATRRAREETEQ